jgi:hypothetical protein
VLLDRRRFVVTYVICVESSRLEQMCVAGVVICTYSICHQELLLRHSPGAVQVLVLYCVSCEISNGSFSAAAIMAYSLACVYNP